MKDDERRIFSISTLSNFFSSSSHRNNLKSDTYERRCIYGWSIRGRCFEVLPSHAVTRALML